MNSSMGERIATHSKWDASANTRQLAFLVFDYFQPMEFYFGMTADRVLDIAYRLNLAVPLSDIENPWILMFMNLGIFMFLFWLAATVFFNWTLLKGQPLALKMAGIGYFVIASTSNSFGRKDVNYLIMISAIVCASGLLYSARSCLRHSRSAADLLCLCRSLQGW